ncbi:MAG: flagellar motor switch protein FliM [Candidatus Glassbacteria bacterium RIFCSPLOWO2_12_FULL_58_11]|uniref:Flagellar motor switch protein FliM n=1 Tax=Candidatus Glassbacteria bacterium RIFCSPLOWO2_12_FULL_58_11 TaxID=1817867 RepID=A0A1F5YYN4_9BACT|nr:MAG: flagellar motor switch protein FliM [Candidatus Glassbacteria bacterium RIFCSPLOWO2_12_FULL_58_11]
MSKILSQDEIDALLSGEGIGAGGGGPAAETAEEDQKEKLVSLYDFKHPNRVSKDQLRTIQTIHESFARGFATHLSTRLRSLVDIDLTSVDQLTYSEFIMSMADPSAVYIFNIKELEGDAILEISPQLVLYIIDRSFGGEGGVIQEAREITIIEQNVMKKIVDNALEQLVRAWQNITPLTLELKDFETNPQLIQISPPGETAIMISFEVKISDFSSLLNLCFPYFVLEDVMPKLSAQHQIAHNQKKRSHHDEGIVRHKIRRADVPVSVNLGTTELTLRDILNLEPGDIVRLDNRLDQMLEVQIGETAKFRAKPGTYRNHKAVQIVSEIKEGAIQNE